MKKEILVKHTHRYTLEKSILYSGSAMVNEYSDYKEVIYFENKDVKVKMFCFDEYIEIHRYGEVNSNLTLKRKSKSSNPMKSCYGTFEIEVYTYDYINEDNYIRVEYDVESGSSEKDGFIVEIELMEDTNERN